MAFEMLFSRLVKAFAVSSPEKVPASMAQLYNIYALFIRCTQQEYIPGSARARIEEARIYIQENITQPELSVESLAQRADMSQVYFRKLFSGIYSVPPSKYILQQRVALACRLMELKELRLEDIALESGFSSLPHMCRVFKEIAGNTPAQYRKKLLQQRG